MTEEETKLVIASMLPDTCTRVGEQLSQHGPVQVSQIAHACEFQGVAALVRYQLHQSGQLQVLPQALRDTLKDLELQNVAADLQRRQEVKKILSLVQEARLDFIVLKGEALAHTLYHAPYLRTRCDTDLLFRNREDTARVWSILDSQGYTRSHTLTGEFVGYQFRCGKPLRGGLTITFDIHSQISDFVWFARKFPFHELFAYTAVATVAGVEVNVPDKPYALLHACLHRVSNKPKGTQDRLIWLYDIHLLCEAFSDQEWRAFVSIAKEKGMAGTCLEGLVRASHYYGTRIPVSCMAELTVTSRVEPEGLSRADRFVTLYIRDFIANKGLGNKARQIGEHLFPTPSYMFGRYAVSNKYLLPYYYIRRFVQGIVKYAK